MNEELFHECFGHCRNDADCRDCDLHGSCACISESEPTIDHGSGLVSFEALEGWEGPVAETGSADDDDGSESPASPELSALSEFCRYIFNLDDYTLGILAEIIAPRSARRDVCVAELARVHRCSRQAMHRKMLSSVKKHPEIAGVFQVALRKIGRCRGAFLHREVGHAG